MSDKNNVDEYLNELDKFSNGKIKNKKDLKILLDICFNESKEKELADLLFTAKYALGLFRIAEREALNPEIKNLDLIKKDIADNIDKIIFIMRSIIIGKNIAPIWEEKYLSLTQESFLNLRLLLNDFEWVKKYSNYMKRKN
jgi:hypothetical protein